MSAPTCTDRHGKPTPLALTMFPPYILIVDGFEVQNFGANKTKARDAYDTLVQQRRQRLGIKPVFMDGGCAL